MSNGMRLWMSLCGLSWLYCGYALAYQAWPYLAAWSKAFLFVAGLDWFLFKFLVPVAGKEVAIQ